SFEAVGAASPRFRVEGAVRLSGPGEIVTRGEEIFLVGVPVDLSQGGNRIIFPGDGTVLVGVAQPGGEEIDQRGVYAVRIILLGLREGLLVIGAEIEEFVFADRPTESAAELLLSKPAQAGAVGKPRGQTGPLLILVRTAVHL